MVRSQSIPSRRCCACALRRLAGLAGLALAALSAQAEAPARSPRPDPLDAQASVPAMRWQSSLQPAGAAAADKPLPWREANDTAARIGGWRAYAREAQQPDPVVKPAAASAPALMPASAAPQPPASAAPQAPAPAAPQAPAMPPGHAGHLRP